MKTVSIGVFAHNEELNCGQMLRALLDQQCQCSKIIEIIVVSSASTDETDAIVSTIAATKPLVRLVREPVRQGKSAAINRYLAEKDPRADICVIAGADVVPDPEAVELLVSAFSDPKVGMAGGRPVPVNKGNRFLGFAVQLQWTMHHLVSLHQPKCGEMVAFRSDLTTAIPKESSVDEASLEAMAVKKGLQLRYVSDAVIRNRGPEKVREFINQRRRIASGHYWLRKTEHYTVATGCRKIVLKALASQPPRKLIEWIWMAGVIGLEISCRLLGLYDFYFRPRIHQAWRIAPTTKKVL
jgi:biofilm PGA synthesis N-glycosyltransferase PgaC